MRHLRGDLSGVEQAAVGPEPLISSKLPGCPSHWHEPRCPVPRLAPQGTSGSASSELTRKLDDLPSAKQGPRCPVGNAQTFPREVETASRGTPQRREGRKLRIQTRKDKCRRCPLAVAPQRLMPTWRANASRALDRKKTP